MKQISSFTSSVAILTNFINCECISKIQENEMYLSESKSFLHTILFKTNNGLDTVNLLIANLQTNPHFIDSSFLIIRTTLSDCLTTYYLLHISNTEEELNINIKKLKSDHIRYTLKNLDIYRDLYQDSRESIECKKQELKECRKDFFDSDGNLIFKDNFSINQIVKQLINQTSPKDHLFETLISQAFSYYDKFSKYEHLGDLTEYLSFRQFDVTNHKEVFEDICGSIHIITLYLSIFLETWRSDNIIDFSKLELLTDKVSNHRLV